MFDVKALEKEAADEVAKEAAVRAKARIKGSLHRIADAERVLANLRAEHVVMMRDIGAD